MNANLQTQGAACGRSLEPLRRALWMSRRTALLLRRLDIALRKHQSQSGPAHSEWPAPSLKRAAALQCRVAAQLQRRSVPVRARNVLSLGRPSAAATWSSAVCQASRRTAPIRNGPQARSPQIGLWPSGVLRRRLSPETRRISSKRARADRRERQFEVRLRAAGGETGLPYHLTMGASETSCKKKVDTLWACTSRLGPPRQPLASMVEALSDFVDSAYLDGKMAVLVGKTKAAWAASHLSRVPRGRLVHPLLDRALRGLRMATATSAIIGCPEGMKCALSGLPRLWGPAVGGCAAVQMLRPTEQDVATQAGEDEMAVELDDKRKTLRG